MIAVADGAGGLGHGDRAADLFVEAARGFSSRDPFDMRAWEELFLRCDSDVHRIGGETTALVVVVGALVAGLSVGDSEAWIVGDKVDRLTEKQSRARLGSGRARPIPFHRRSLDGVLVVGTDGLFKYVSEAVIRASPDPKRLISSSPDDSTCVAVRVSEGH